MSCCPMHLEQNDAVTFSAQGMGRAESRSDMRMDLIKFDAIKTDKAKGEQSFSTINKPCKLRHRSFADRLKHEARDQTTIKRTQLHPILEKENGECPP